MKLSYSNVLASDNLREKQAEIQATLKSIDGQISRLMMWAHEDEARASNEMQRLLHKHPDGTSILEILASDTQRLRHFGPLKTAFSTRKYQTQLPGPLAELPEVFRDRRDALARAGEVAKAYRDALESEEGELFEERSRAQVGSEQQRKRR